MIKVEVYRSLVPEQGCTWSQPHSPHVWHYDTGRQGRYFICPGIEATRVAEFVPASEVKTNA